jgi:hypothetical protein
MPNLFIPSFLGIGVREFSGNNVTILLARFFILPTFPPANIFSKFCGLFNEFFFFEFDCLLFCRFIFFK